ncbi:hypothetical protein E4U53_008031 [Claviceps sorghi]|nr:hypothetical protein E4U53_008031 [Claviceps sorghi]
MPTQPPAPLPLATNRAALSNKISLLLAQRTSLLRSLTRDAGSAAPHTPDEPPATRPNEGVGYVRPAEGTAPDDPLRRRLLGKRKKGDAPRRVYESESDSEEGRGSLGRKRRRGDRDAGEVRGEAAPDVEDREAGQGGDR